MASGGERIAIIDEPLAKRLFAGEDPIDRLIQLPTPYHPPGESPGPGATSLTPDVLRVVGVVAGALMAFTLSMDEIIISWFTVGPDSQTLPLKIFARVKKGLDPSLNAISALFIVATAGLVVLSEWIKRSSREVSKR